MSRSSISGCKHTSRDRVFPAPHSCSLTKSLLLEEGIRRPAGTLDVRSLPEPVKPPSTAQVTSAPPSPTSALRELSFSITTRAVERDGDIAADPAGRGAPEGGRARGAGLTLQGSGDCGAAEPGRGKRSVPGRCLPG